MSVYVACHVKKYHLKIHVAVHTVSGTCNNLLLTFCLPSVLFYCFLTTTFIVPNRGSTFEIRIRDCSLAIQPFLFTPHRQARFVTPCEMSLAARSGGIWLFLQSTAIVTCSYFMAVMCSAPWQPAFVLGQQKSQFYTNIMFGILDFRGM